MPVLLLLVNLHHAFDCDRLERAVRTDTPVAGLLAVHIDRVLRGQRQRLDLQGVQLTVIDLR